jgi:oligopeptidase B
MKKQIITLGGVLIIGMLFLQFGIIVSCAPKAVPPVAPIHAKVDTVFGHVMVDDYAWLRDRDNPQVMPYLEAENAYTDAMMKPTDKFQEDLYQEMVGRIKETDMSVPTKWGNYYYYTRTVEKEQYDIQCRKKDSLDAPEQVLLDGNKEAEGTQFWDLGVFKVSPDQNLLAFAVDTMGNELYTLRVKSLVTGELFPDVIDSVTTGLEWANDSRTFFYTIPDEAWRPYKVYRHRLGENVSKDRMMYHEPDESFWIDLSKSKSERFIYLQLGSETTTEIRFLDANIPDGDFTLANPRQDGMEYYLHDHGHMFFIRTNDGAKNFKVMQAPISDPRKARWEPYIPTSDSVMINDIEVFRDFMVVYEREYGLKQIRIKEFAPNIDYMIDFPEPVYTTYGAWNPDYNGEMLRYVYTSLITSESVYDYNMRTRERVLRKQEEVLGGYDPSNYESKQIFATARDGTKVPISIVYRKDREQSGSKRLLLYGYGAYGISSDPTFRSYRISLLDRGFAYAIAHVRGGGEMGRYWYDEGKLLNKKNTFYDFIDCSEYLISKGYTTSENLAIYGGSAGGLLIGAVLNMRPELYDVAVADVPFVDLINTMMDSTIPLTVIEYDEWGNPHEKEYFDYMLSYSPYDNVKAQNYPNMFVLAGLNDTRVHYWEPAKWVAKLRATKTGDNLLLLKVNMESGHSGASGRYDFLKEVALEYAYMFHMMGIER